MNKNNKVEVKPNKKTGEGHLNKEFVITFSQSISDSWLRNLIQTALDKEQRNQAIRQDGWYIKK